MYKIIASNIFFVLPFSRLQNYEVYITSDLNYYYNLVKCVFWGD